MLSALADDTRLAIIRFLADCEDRQAMCGSFLHITTKSNLTYHVGKLREAGVVRVTPEGTRRLISLRRGELDALFPGLLDSILAGIPKGTGETALRELAAEHREVAAASN
ncbi:ArsR/SmtB family transcription factor [Devosia nitrariae]|uniref:ArsR/SmtB family transcription factor n=1 Tax=Devosia nitrariae TaxID=2071872 RepID=UPI0024E11ADC|nr:helix-turn-helix domain-containing protein [Devosia nitrariae]